MDFIPCTTVTLPQDQMLAAANTAIEQNPVNRPAGVSEPQKIAVLTSKYWGAKGVKLGVAFMDNPSTALRAMLLSHMNAWGQWSNVTFAEVALGNAEVRISRGVGGYWSYVGTDVLHIPRGQQTMNLEGFTEKTPDSEFRRVVRHETGHTLGCPHEHLRKELVARLDVQKTIAYFMRTQGWSEQDVRQQVLTPISEASLMGTPHADAQSIMCYQLPGSITTDGQPIVGGLDIDKIDADFMAKTYPKPDAPQPPKPSGKKFQVLLEVDPDARTVTQIGK